MRVNEHTFLLNMSGQTTGILMDNKVESDIIIVCPNCGQPARYGNTRMISGYVGCDAPYKEGTCYFDDLQPRVITSHASADPHVRRKYIKGLLYSEEKVMSSIQLLKPTDYQAIKEMDQLSGNDVEFWMDSDMAYGLFRNRQLIGYLTMGYADDLDKEVEMHPHYHSNARVLSNVFIKEEFRNNGFGHYFVHQVLDSVYEVTFLTLTNPKLEMFYRQLAFDFIHEHTMSRLP